MSWQPILTILLSGSLTAAAQPLYEAAPLTAAGSFTAGIEGPACDAEGTLYAVNYQRQGTIGRVTPGGEATVFVTLPVGSVGNGIRFDSQGMMYVADYKKHNVLRVDMETKKVSVFAHDQQFHQPNDLAVAPDDTLYASDPSWQEGTGRVWRIDRQGQVNLAAAEMGTTNGIEVSPDGSTLYVNETRQRKLWAFRIAADGSLAEKRRLTQFPDHGTDGMRCDVAGNLYVTRYGKGTVAVISPAGRMLREIVLPGARPSNLCFGGADGCTVYVTEVERRQIVSFRAEMPGAAWQRWHTDRQP